MGDRAGYCAYSSCRISVQSLFVWAEGYIGASSLNHSLPVLYNHHNMPVNAATTRRAKALGYAPPSTQSTEVAREILESSNTDIVQGIKDKRWTSTDALGAFVGRAVEAQDATNCLTEGEQPVVNLACVPLNANVCDALPRSHV